MEVSQSRLVHRVLRRFNVQRYHSSSAASAWYHVILLPAPNIQPLAVQHRLLALAELPALLPRCKKYLSKTKALVVESSILHASLAFCCPESGFRSWHGHVDKNGHASGGIAGPVTNSVIEMTCRERPRRRLREPTPCPCALLLTFYASTSGCKHSPVVRSLELESDKRGLSDDIPSI
jgi:hypothetical protein